jgi:hypothetical protein
VAERYTYFGSFDIDKLKGEVLAAGLPDPGDQVWGSGFRGPGTFATCVQFGYASPLTAQQEQQLHDLAMAHQPGTEADHLAALLRRAAGELLSGPSPSSKALRATLLALVGEINLLRARLRAQDDALANFTGSTAAAALTDLKARWGALAAAQPMAERTAQQLRGFVQGQIDNGNAD